MFAESVAKPNIEIGEPQGLTRGPSAFQVTILPFVTLYPPQGRQDIPGLITWRKTEPQRYMKMERSTSLLLSSPSVFTAAEIPRRPYSSVPTPKSYLLYMCVRRRRRRRTYICDKSKTNVSCGNALDNRDLKGVAWQPAQERMPNPPLSCSSWKTSAVLDPPSSYTYQTRRGTVEMV